LAVLYSISNEDAIYEEEEMKPTEQSASPNGSYVAPRSDARTAKKDKSIELVGHRGGSDISKNASSEILSRTKREGPGELSSLVASLSDRELEVFSLLGRARTTRQIAGELCLSIKTIETHLSRIKVKLGIESFNELIVSAALWMNSRKA
jgi:DNA-binding CsgD family transcriptional regulator